MGIVPVFAKEEEVYSIQDIRNALGYGDSSEQSDRETRNFIKDLLARQVIKRVRKPSSGSDEWKEDIEEIVKNDYSDIDLVRGEKYYKFSFVGIVINRNKIIYAYPKYVQGEAKLSVDASHIEVMHQVIMVIQKYCIDTKKDSSFDSFNLFADNAGETDNILSIMFFLLLDYERYGEYEKTEDILDINGEGQINWQRTIDNTYPVISDGQPYYVELYTWKNVNDDEDYIRRLHRYVVGRCSKEVTEALLHNFFNLPELGDTDDEEYNFGDEDYIKYRLRRELTDTFEDRKIMVLKAMLAYFEGNKVLLGDETIQLIGTRYFNLVWEHVCATVFDSQKDSHVKDVIPDLVQYDIDDWKISQNPTLVELIEKPRWQKEGGTEIVASGTLNPDALRYVPGGPVLYILDAKYYCPDWNERNIKNEPGIMDIVKQYMYRLAYKSLEKKYTNIEYRNYFLMPRRNANDDVKGKTWLKYLVDMKLGEIGVRFLDPKKMFDLYLSNDHKSVEDLD